MVPELTILGNLYYDKAKSRKYYWKAVSIEDNFPQPHLISAVFLRNDIRGAIVEFEKALKLIQIFLMLINLAVICRPGHLINAANALENLNDNTLQPSVSNLALICLEKKRQRSV